MSENNNNNTLISVYPNPNNGNCKISGDSNFEITIVNQLGQIMFSDFLNETNNRQITLFNLANGVYFIVSKGNERKINQKVVVIK